MDAPDRHTDKETNRRVSVRLCLRWSLTLLRWKQLMSIFGSLEYTVCTVHRSQRFVLNVDAELQFNLVTRFPHYIYKYILCYWPMSLTYVVQSATLTYVTHRRSDMSHHCCRTPSGVSIKLYIAKSRRAQHTCFVGGR